MNNKIQLTNEILEHTKDCDYNRAQHFVEHKFYDSISKVLNLLQIISLFCLVIFCSIIIPELEFKNEVYKYAVPILLSLVATTAQLIDYFFGFSDLSQQHWLAAQAYARLYRQCQFFPSHYGTSCDEQIMREAASNICNELFDLNLMSPTLSQRSYKKVKYLEQKEYPIQSTVYNHRISQLLPVSELLKNAFKSYEIEIFVFGSYITELVCNDVDIAVIVHSDDTSEIELSKIVLEIEKQLRKNSIRIDLTLLTKKNLNSASKMQFINNIKKGKQLYISPTIDKSITDYSYNIELLTELKDKYYAKIEQTIASNDILSMINNSFYYVKTVISYILMQKNISWAGDYEMVSLFEQQTIPKDLKMLLENLYHTLKKYKNREASIGIDEDLTESEKENIINTIKEIHKTSV